MRKLTVLLMLVFALAMAGGCAKKVASTPAGTTASGAGEGSAAAPSGVNDAQLKAIDKIGADRIYFAFDKSDLTEESRQILTEKSELLKSFPARFPPGSVLSVRAFALGKKCADYAVSIYSTEKK